MALSFHLADGAFISQFAGDYLSGEYPPGAIAVVDRVIRKIVSRVAVRASPFALAIAPDRDSLWVTYYFADAGLGVVTEV